VLIFDYLAQSPAAFIITAGIFGLFLGSFLNVVIHRSPIMLDKEWRQAAIEILNEQGFNLDTESEKEKEPYNLVVPRSGCPKCGHQITAAENIPVISYIFLGGKCSGCKTPITIRYPSIELLTGLVFLFAAFHFGWSIQAAATMVLASFLIPLIFIDLLIENYFLIIWFIPYFGLVSFLTSMVHLSILKHQLLVHWQAIYHCGVSSGCLSW